MMTGRGTQHSLVLITLLSTSLFSVFVSAADDNKNYSFGVVPQQSAQRLANLWGPVFAYVSKETGVKLQFKTAKNIPEFEKRLMAGDYDFAYMNPYHFTIFNQNPGYRAVAVRKGQPIKGIIVVRKDSAIQSLEELEGQTLAFP
ncbi:MAG: phosphonate transport system substrate-binding protein, partial [Candidatus Endobugula sp.]